MRFNLTRSCAVLLGLLAGVAATGSTRAPRPDADEETLRQAKVPSDAKGVQKYLQDQCGTEADADKVAALVQQLGASGFKDREDASKRIIALGTLSLPWLYTAQRDRDPEIVARAGKCLMKITQRRLPHAISAAVRRVVTLSADGAAATLLRLLPYAVEQQQQEDVWFGLDALAAGQKALDQAFQAAIRDKLASRRAAAAYVLGRRGKEKEQQLARKALTDEDLTVRLRAAQGLLARQDRAAVAALLDLLEKAEVEVAWQAEELLHWLAGKTGPQATVGAGSVEARKRCRAAWGKWWQKHAAKVDLAEPVRAYRRPGLVLVHERDRDAVPREGNLWLCGCDGRVRWRLDGIDEVRDAQWLAGGRLLLAEGCSSSPIARGAKDEDPPLPRNYGLSWRGGITERDLNGKIVWKSEAMTHPDRCERLADGTMVVLSGHRWGQVAPDGKLLVSGILHLVWHGPSRGIALCQRLANGNLLFQNVPQPGALELIELEQGRQARRQIRLKDRIEVSNLLTGVEALANGNYLVANPRDSSVREVDAQGTTVWRSATLGGAYQTRRLPGDTILVADVDRVIELGRGGQVLWETIARKGKIWRAWPSFNLVRLGFDAPRPNGFDLDRDVPYRLKGQRDKEVRVRRANAYLLGKLGTKAESAIPALLEAQDDPDAEVRRLASRTIEAAATLASLPVFIRASRDRRPLVRATACWHLRKYTGQGQQVVFALLSCLGDEDAEVRRNAANVLRQFKANADMVVPALVKALDDKDPGDQSRSSVSRMAADSLSAFGENARVAIPALLKAAKAKDWRMRLQVARSFGQLMLPAPAIEKALQDALHDENPDVRDAANSSLKRLRNMSR
jgi:HEAT repeat protein